MQYDTLMLSLKSDSLGGTIMLENHPFNINEKGHLSICGADAVQLAEDYGTPLYVYDVNRIRKNCRVFTEAFKEAGVKSQVSYASKAFSCVAILEVIQQEGLSLDVVSHGELYTAMKAGFPSEKIHFHGNNKNETELQAAIDYDIGCIVIDNFYEIKLLEKLLSKANKQMNVLLRVTPGIESETHQYIMTGNEDSKFGFNLENGQADEAFRLLHNHSHIRVQGLHSHIGSQIFNTNSFVMAVSILYKQIAVWYESFGYEPNIMNFGGGFGIRYTKSDEPIENDEHIRHLITAVKKETTALGINMPEIWIEPGRSIVGDAGLTLYTVGSMKDIQGVRKYVAVDGGMADNIRPALYDAPYEAVVANKANEKNKETVSIAGKCCESGDMLIWDLPVPAIEAQDILAVFATGAYGYSMASNYNRLFKPAVVFVEDGVSQLVVKRETLDDIVKNDLTYKPICDVATGSN